MQRVMIIGQPGSGKSTLARKLGTITWLPVYHMDQIHWMPGWRERSREEKTLLCREVHARDRWIFEGGHSTTWPERLARADTVIWLDFGLTRRVQRVARRTLAHYGQTRPELPENCPERFNPEFYRYIWRTRHSGRERMRQLLTSAGAEKSTHHLTSSREINRFLFDVKRAMKSGALGVPHR